MNEKCDKNTSGKALLLVLSSVLFAGSSFLVGCDSGGDDDDAVETKTVTEIVEKETRTADLNYVVVEEADLSPKGGDGCVDYVRLSVIVTGGDPNSKCELRWLSSSAVLYLDKNGFAENNSVVFGDGSDCPCINEKIEADVQVSGKKQTLKRTYKKNCS